MQDHWGETPLMDAAVGGHYFAARELLSHNADPNIRNDEFRNALDLVCTGEICSRKYEEVLRRELQRYMDLNPENILQRSQKKVSFEEPRTLSMDQIDVPKPVNEFLPRRHSMDDIEKEKKSKKKDKKDKKDKKLNSIRQKNTPPISNIPQEPPLLERAILDQSNPK